jgi:FkbM family methyltransferase
MKQSTAIINYDDLTLDIKANNPQQLSTTLMVLGRLIGLRREFRKVISPDPENIIDCGANVGAYSIMFHYCFPEANIIAIEPSSYNMPYITHNCKDIPNIEIRQLAVGSKFDRGVLAQPTLEQREMHNDFLDIHTACLSMYGASSMMKEEVDIFPLDELDLRRPVGFIKIDTEGSDLEVLKGAEKLLKEDKPNILIEIYKPNLAMAGVEPRDIFRLLAGWGFAPFYIYGKDYLFRYVGVDYFFDILDYKFMEGTPKGWAG